MHFLFFKHALDAFYNANAFGEAHDYLYNHIKKNSFKASAHYTQYIYNKLAIDNVLEKGIDTLTEEYFNGCILRSYEALIKAQYYKPKEADYMKFIKEFIANDYFIKNYMAISKHPDTKAELNAEHLALSSQILERYGGNVENIRLKGIYWGVALYEMGRVLNKVDTLEYRKRVLKLYKRVCLRMSVTERLFRHNKLFKIIGVYDYVPHRHTILYMLIVCIIVSALNISALIIIPQHKENMYHITTDDIPLYDNDSSLQDGSNVLAETLLPIEAEELENAVQPEYYIIIGEAVNMRNEPSINSDIIRIIGKNEYLEYLHEEKYNADDGITWCKTLDIGTGKVGWISRKYIEPVSSNINESVPDI